MMTTLDLARAYVAAGLGVLPIRADGSKAPKLPKGHKFLKQLPTDADLARWFSDGRLGIGIPGGRVSGNLETIDFERIEFFERWRDLVGEQAPGLTDRLSCVQTPGHLGVPGMHVRYRVLELEVPGSTSLAGRPVLDENGEPVRDERGRPLVDKIIETRGEGGYALAPGCPPECHKTKGTYEHVAGPDLCNLPELTAEERDILIETARSFDACVSDKDQQAESSASSLRPGDDFEVRGPDWAEILDGWKCVRTDGAVRYWKHPQAHGIWSATTGFCKSGGVDLLHVFSTGAELPEGSYSKFRVYAMLRHGGDLSAAARDLAACGYGSREPKVAATPKHETNGHHERNGKARLPKKSIIRLPESYKPLPLEVLPEPMRSYVDHAARALGCDPSYVALPALSACAALIGNTRVIRLKRGWTEPSVIWTGIVGDSGTLKTPAYNTAIGHLYRLQANMIRQHKLDLDLSDEDSKGPPLQRILCSDATIESLAQKLEENPRGLLLARDELAGWFGSFTRYKGTSGTSDLPNWLELFRAGTLVIDRKTGDKQTVYVRHAAMSVTGGIQPRTLARALTSDLFDAGLAARVLLSMPTRRSKVWSEVEISEEVERRYHDMLEGLLGLEFDTNSEGIRIPHELKMSPEAKDEWVKFFTEWAAVQAAAEGEMAACYSKLEGYAARFALLHHVVSHVGVDADDRREIGTTSVWAGAALCHWFAREARRIYGLLMASEERQQVCRLADFISHRGQVTARDLHRSNPSRYPTAQDAERALRDLVDSGVAEWIDAPSGPKGGRPTRYVRIVISTHDETDETDATATTDETPSRREEANDNTC